MRVLGSVYDKAPVLFPAGLGDAPTEAVAVVSVPSDQVDYGYGPGKVGDLALFLSIASSLALIFRK